MCSKFKWCLDFTVSFPSIPTSCQPRSSVRIKTILGLSGRSGVSALLSGLEEVLFSVFVAFVRAGDHAITVHIDIGKLAAE